MSSGLAGRRVLLGVTGSIAAYKAAELASRLTQAGAEVQVVMTKAACRFVTPLTFQALTGKRTGFDMWEGDGSGSFEHLSFAREADIVLIAPATANFIAKMANGIADDLLSAAVLASGAPLLVAPAMNTAMLRAGATGENLGRLRGRGAEITGPGTGHLACGEEGEGRLADIDVIIAAVSSWLERMDEWKGRHVLVTAGPTREPLDAVRHISNPSSGRMGYAVARAARRRGAEVVLVSGPVELPPPPGVSLVRVVTGEEMRQAVLERFEWSHLLVKTAAVTDYRPVEFRKGKNKEASWELRLEKVGNILEELVARKNGHVMVGFAAEAGDPGPEGARKLAERGLDLVVANDISGPESGFGSEKNRATLVFPGGILEPLPMMGKGELAERILDAVAGKLAPRTA